MTTSPPETPQVRASDQLLQVERAASIGWFFIESYYDFYNKNVENIFKIYHTDASVSHSEFPTESQDGLKSVYKATGIEAIKAMFTVGDNVKKPENRIIITSADFEVSLKDMILISVLGEWSKNKSQFYQFTQTFLLVPGKKENTFDVANDFLRFIEFDDLRAQEKVVHLVKPFEEEKKENKKSLSPEVQSEENLVPKKEDKTTEVQETEPKIENVEKAETRETTEKAETKAETKESAKEQQMEKPTEEKVKVSEERNHDSNGTKQPEVTAEPDALASEDEKEKTEESKPRTPISWAALASQAPPKSGSKTSPSIKAASTRKVPGQPAGQLTSQPPQLSHQIPNPQGVKYKKEDWFPIYIRGVKLVDEKRLKAQLIKKFGPIKFFKLNMNIAFCDFVTEESQKKALEAKEIYIDDVAIQLEPRESKNSNNNNKKAKDHKDLKDKSVNGNGDFKRKSDKKQNGKKKAAPTF